MWPPEGDLGGQFIQSEKSHLSGGGKLEGRGKAVVSVSISFLFVFTRFNGGNKLAQSRRL